MHETVEFPRVGFEGVDAVKRTLTIITFDGEVHLDFWISFGASFGMFITKEQAKLIGQKLVEASASEDEPLVAAGDSSEEKS